MVDSKRLCICLSSSTLNEFWMEGYTGDLIHVDWVTSPGAKIEDLLHMWKADYKDEKKPMDLLLVCGLNNILKEDDSSTIISKFEIRAS